MQGTEHQETQRAADQVGINFILAIQLVDKRSWRKTGNRLAHLGHVSMEASDMFLEVEINLGGHLYSGTPGLGICSLRLKQLVERHGPICAL